MNTLNLIKLSFLKSNMDFYDAMCPGWFLWITLVILLISVAGQLGLVIYSGIWWSYIRYDFPHTENHCSEAYKLYNVVTTLWTMPIPMVAFGVIFCIIHPKLNEVIDIICIFIYGAAGIGYIVVGALAVGWSRGSACDKIEASNLTYGRTTKGFISWASKHEDKVKDLKYYQCTKGHKMTTIFFSIETGAIILFIIFWGVNFCRASYEMSPHHSNTEAPLNA